MDGAMFMTERSRDPALSAIPVVVLSAIARARVAMDVMAHLQKPIDPDELLAIIERCC
jgi:CheY-like chemotaxis protein